MNREPFREAIEEKPEDVFDFLNEFTKNYSDYSTVLDPERVDYVDICFGTAASLFTVLENCHGKAKAFETSLDEMIRGGYLTNDAYIIEGAMDTNSQNHAWIMVPYRNFVILLQSLGAIYGAFYTIWNPNDLMEELKKLPSPSAAAKLFYFVDDKIQRNQVTLKYQVCPRRRMHRGLLPDLRKEKAFLDPLRGGNLKGRGVNRNNYKTLDPYGVYLKNKNMYIDNVGTLYRVPDAFEKIWEMHTS